MHCSFGTLLGGCFFSSQFFPELGSTLTKYSFADTGDSISHCFYQNSKAIGLVNFLLQLILQAVDGCR